MSHPNARLTPRARLEMVRQVLEGWPAAEVARQFRVSRATVTKWVRRFHTEGAAGLEDRSSAPHHRPRRTPAALAERICAVRHATGWGPHRIAWALGLAHQTVYVVLRRAGLPPPATAAPREPPHRALRAGGPRRAAARGREETGARP